MFAVRRKTVITFQNRDPELDLLFECRAAAGLPYFPAPGGAPFDRNFVGQKREESIKPLPFARKMKEKMLQLDTSTAVGQWLSCLHGTLRRAVLFPKCP